MTSEPKSKVTIENIEIPVAAYTLIIELLEQIAQGNTARILPFTKELYITQAAYLLNVSKKYMWQLLNEGTIPYQIIRNCRTMKYEDVIKYKLKSREESRKAMDEIVAHQEALGLYD